MASPRTNLLAPSIEPKKSDSCETSARRLRASSSPIRPALRSASIAICLPGMASRVKRAPTSAIRPAPLVMTMKLMIVRMMKTMIPTAKFPPTRKWPKASITLPAASGPVCPCSSTTRVEATFSDRRSSVANSSTAGNAAKSSGLRVNMATSRIITDNAMLKVNSRSSRNVGRGSTIMPSTITIRMGPASSRACVPPLLFNMVSNALIP